MRRSYSFFIETNAVSQLWSTGAPCTKQIATAFTPQVLHATMQHAVVYPHFVFACLPSIACVRVGHLRLEVCGRVEAQRCFVIIGSISISILRVMFVHWILGVGLYIQRKFYGVVLVVLVDIYIKLTHTHIW